MNNADQGERRALDRRAVGEAALRPWSPFFSRDYTLLWSASVIATVGSRLRQVANFYQVYALSGSSLKLGLTGFFQAIPFIVFGLFGGAVADVFDRKKLIAITQVLNMLPGLALGVLTATGAIQVWHIYVVSLISSLVQAFGHPARTAIMPSLVPPSHLMSAITLTTATQQVSFLFGPLVAGVLIDHLSLDATYFIDAAIHVPVVAAVLAIRTTGSPGGRTQRLSFRSMVEGVEFIWTERIIFGLCLLDFGVVLVGYYQPLLPIFASDVFGLGATGFGVLYGGRSVGAIAGLFTLLLAGNVRRKGVLSVVAALSFAASLALLGLSGSFWMAVIAVGALGFTDAVGVSVRRTVVQLLAPDDMRGRANSVIGVFAQSTNALGAVVAGAVAALVGAPKAVLVGSVFCAVIIIGINRAIPQVWRYRSE
jgi:MFS family permease